MTSKTDPLWQHKLVDIVQKKNTLTPDYGIAFDAKQTPIELKAQYAEFRSYSLEIGSGWGEFTLESAKQSPTTLFIAIEKKRKRVLRCIKNQKKLGLTNIRWLVLDITWFFDDLFLGETFDSVTINFPDPWPKARHQKHRFMSSDTLTTLTKICKDKARLTFASDHWPYIEEVLYGLEAHPHWRNYHGQGGVVLEIPSRPQSYFEQLKRSQGHPCFFLQFEKQA